MSVSQGDLDHFHHFATHEITQLGDVATMEVLVDRWRAQQEHTDTVASIRRGIENADSGRVHELVHVRAKIGELKASSRYGARAEPDTEQVVQAASGELAAEGIRN